MIYLHHSLPGVFYNQRYVRILGDIPVRWHTASTQGTVLKTYHLAPNLKSTNMTVHYRAVKELNSLSSRKAKYKEVFKTTVPVVKPGWEFRHALVSPTCSDHKVRQPLGSRYFWFPLLWLNIMCWKACVWLETFQHSDGHRIIWAGRDLGWSLVHPPAHSGASCEAGPGYWGCHPARSNTLSHPEDKYFTSWPVTPKQPAIKFSFRFFKLLSYIYLPLISLQVSKNPMFQDQPSHCHYFLFQRVKSLQKSSKWTSYLATAHWHRS